MPFRVLEYSSEDLQSQVFFVAQPVCLSLDDADLVVEPFDEAERDLVFESAIGGKDARQ